MRDWLRRWGFPSRARPARETLLNDGLALAMDWGEHWLAPIQGRLARQHPHLQRAELDELDALCQEALRFGHETVHDLVRQHGREVAYADFSALFLAKHTWASAGNCARLFDQGLYYAWKTGGPSGRA
jgi:hypothetical protein